MGQYFVAAVLAGGIVAVAQADQGYQNTENRLDEWNYLPDSDWRAIGVAVAKVRK